MTMKQNLGDVIIEYFGCLTKEEQTQLKDLFWELGRHIKECGYEAKMMDAEDDVSIHSENENLFQRFYEKLSNEFSLIQESYKPQQKQERNEVELHGLDAEETAAPETSGDFTQSNH